MNPNDSILDSELRRDEGVKRMPYLDTKGILTVGVGHNLAAKPLDLAYPLTDEQIDQILAADLITTFSALDAHLGWWRTLSYARQRVLVNMCFNLGITRLLAFHHFLDDAQAGEYEAAAQEMLNSLWAKQVGDRANRLAQLMRDG